MTNNTTIPCFPMSDSSEVPFGTLVLTGLLTGVCVLLGCIGNISFITKIKLHQLKIGQSLRAYLIILLTWDCLVLIFAFGYYGLAALVQLVCKENVLHFTVWKYFVVVCYGPLSTATTGSAWTTIAIAFARYFAISRPFYSSRVYIRAWLANIAVTVLVVLYTFPCYFELKLVHCQTVHGQEDIIVWPQLQYNKAYQTIYRTICFFLFVTLGPFIVTMVMSVHLIILLRRRIPKHETTLLLIRNERSHRKAGVLLLILLMKFLACNLLPTILMICRTVVGAELFNSTYVKLLADFGNFFVVLNSATNFLVYLIWQKVGLERKRFKSETIALSDLDSRSSSFMSSSRIGDPTFTASEVKILEKTWQEEKEKNGTTLCIRMIDHLISKHSVLERSLENTTADRVAGDIFIFFDHIVDQVVNKNQIPSQGFRKIGKIHRNAGVRLTNQILKDFKHFMMSEILEEEVEDTKNCSSVEAAAWNKLLSAVIADLKLGYLLSEHQLSVSYNTDSVVRSYSGCSHLSK